MICGRLRETGSLAGEEADRNYDDIIRAIRDGNLDKIVDERIRYMKETDREIWNV